MNNSSQIGVKVNVVRGYDCDRCGTFTPYKHLVTLGNTGFCSSCAFQLGRNICVISENASEIGKIASSLTEDAEDFADVRDAIVEMSNEIYGQTVLRPRKISVEHS